MSRLNIKPLSIFTREGATAKRISPEMQLRRSVMTCLLWESEFYEDGVAIADRIASLAAQVPEQTVQAIAIEARERQKLRHAPLLLTRILAKAGSKLTAGTLERVIQRADELAEFLALYWKDGKQPLSAQVKKGLARAFVKFDEYQLAKYNRDGAIKLRDVLFLIHAKPKDEVQAHLWKRLAEGEIAIPDTWEVALSAGADKKATFERLIRENKLGALAFLRNIRNMRQAGIELDFIRNGLKSIKADRVLPFRFISVARFAPALEPELEALMFECLEKVERLTGETVVLVDVSGSMDAKLSAKSDMSRLDAGTALAVLLRELCDRVRVFSFSSTIVEVPPRRGFALAQAVRDSQAHNSTDLGGAIRHLNAHVKHDRLIVITDEQSQTPVPDPKSAKSYMINVASNKNGVGYGTWTHIDGWSESVVDYVSALERERLG